VLLSNYGYCLLRLGRVDEAVAAITRAVQADPGNLETVKLLELARERQAQGNGAASR
jgi:Tfp pilus assembly protein PilF